MILHLTININSSIGAKNPNNEGFKYIDTDAYMFRNDTTLYAIWGRECRMITLTARIQLFGNGSNSVKSVTSTNPPNNISNSINNIKNKRIRSGNAFIIGSSKIGDGSTLSNGVDY